MKIRAALFFLFAAVAAHAADFSQLDKPAKQFLRNFAAGKLDAAARDFNADMRKAVTPAYLAQMKQQSDEQLGIFLTLADVRHETTPDGLRVVEMIARFARGPASMKVFFDAHDRIASLQFHPISVSSADPKLETAAREVLADFNEGRFEAMSKRFEPSLRAQLPPARLTELARQVNAVYGGFLSVADVRAAVANQQTTVELKTRYEKAAVSVRVVFDRAGQVAGLKFARTETR